MDQQLTMKMFQVAWCGPSSSLGALGARVVKVGTAIGPTGRHTGRCAFFMAFFTRLINKGTTFVIHIENPLESISPQTQDGVDSLVRIWFHAQGTLLAGCGAV